MTSGKGLEGWDEAVECRSGAGITRAAMRELGTPLSEMPSKIERMERAYLRSQMEPMSQELVTQALAEMREAKEKLRQAREQREAAQEHVTTAKEKLSLAKGIRTFDTGATRSPLGDKLQYEGYLNPLVLKAYARYMKRHQTASDGSQREPDNWQKGIPKGALIDSAWRHFSDWHLHHRGYTAEAEETLEEALCAILFNVMGYLKQVLEAPK